MCVGGWFGGGWGCELGRVSGGGTRGGAKRILTYPNTRACEGSERVCYGENVRRGESDLVGPVAVQVARHAHTPEAWTPTAEFYTTNKAECACGCDDFDHSKF